MFVYMHKTFQEEYTRNWNTGLFLQRETGWLRDKNGRETTHFTPSVPFDVCTVSICFPLPNTIQELEGGFINPTLFLNKIHPEGAQPGIQAACDSEQGDLLSLGPSTSTKRTGSPDNPRRYDRIKLIHLTNPIQEYLTVRIHSKYQYGIYMPGVFPVSLPSLLLLKMTSLNFQLLVFAS